MSICLYLNTCISAIIEARDTKFGNVISVYYT